MVYGSVLVCLFCGLRVFWDFVWLFCGLVVCLWVWFLAVNSVVLIYLFIKLKYWWVGMFDLIVVGYAVVWFCFGGVSVAT